MYAFSIVSYDMVQSKFTSETNNDNFEIINYLVMLMKNGKYRPDKLSVKGV